MGEPWRSFTATRKLSPGSGPVNAGRRRGGRQDRGKAAKTAAVESAGKSDHTSGEQASGDRFHERNTLNRTLSARSSPPAEGGRGRPSDVSRAVASMAIAIYLVGLGLSMAANTGSGSSALIRTIKGRLFAPWLVPAWLDLGFDYRLTYGTAEDAAHGLQVARFTGGSTPGLALPGDREGERAARWRRLARTVLADRDDADRDGLLAAAVGQGAFDDLGVEDVVVRVMTTPLPERGGPVPVPTQALVARVRRVAGDLQLLRSEPRGELAPVVRPADAASDGPVEPPR